MADPVDSYRTLKGESSGLYKDKGSKFHAYAFHVSTIEEVEACLEKVRKDHHSARHHCYAYRLEADGSAYRANDDGEPAHSAGDPILGQIDSHELTEVLIIVVRYFGGVKLGVGGLINAYRSAAKEALDDGRIVTTVVKCRIRVDFSYARMSEVMRIMKQTGADMKSNQFEVSCTLVAEMPLSDKADFLAAFEELHDVEVSEIL